MSFRLGPSCSRPSAGRRVSPVACHSPAAARDKASPPSSGLASIPITKLFPIPLSSPFRDTSSDSISKQPLLVHHTSCSTLAVNTTHRPITAPRLKVLDQANAKPPPPPPPPPPHSAVIVRHSRPINSDNPRNSVSVRASAATSKTKAKLGSSSTRGRDEGVLASGQENITSTETSLSGATTRAARAAASGAGNNSCTRTSFDSKSKSDRSTRNNAPSVAKPSSRSAARSGHSGAGAPVVAKTVLARKNQNEKITPTLAPKLATMIHRSDRPQRAPAGTSSTSSSPRSSVYSQKRPSPGAPPSPLLPVDSDAATFTTVAPSSTTIAPPKKPTTVRLRSVHEPVLSAKSGQPHAATSSLNPSLPSPNRDRRSVVTLKPGSRPPNSPSSPTTLTGSTHVTSTPDHGSTRKAAVESLSLHSRSLSANLIETAVATPPSASPTPAAAMRRSVASPGPTAAAAAAASRNSAVATNNKAANRNSKFFYASEAKPKHAVSKQNVPRQPPTLAPSSTSRPAAVSRPASFFHANGDSVDLERTNSRSSGSQSRAPHVAAATVTANPPTAASSRKFFYANGAPDVDSRKPAAATNHGVRRSDGVPLARLAQGNSRPASANSNTATPNLGSHAPKNSSTITPHLPSRCPPAPHLAQPRVAPTVRVAPDHSSRSGPPPVPPVPPPVQLLQHGGHGKSVEEALCTSKQLPPAPTVTLPTIPPTDPSPPSSVVSPPFAPSLTVSNEHDDQASDMPVSPTRSHNSSNDPLADLVANARRERKVQDLEIRNASLEAINRTLERQMRKQQAEIRRYRRLTRAGRISSIASQAPSRVASQMSNHLCVPSTRKSDSSELESPATDQDVKSDDLFEVYPPQSIDVKITGSDDQNDDDNIDDEPEDVADPSFSSDTESVDDFLPPDQQVINDAKHREKDERRLNLDLTKHQQLLVASQKINQSLKRCLDWSDMMIADGRKALAYHVNIGDVALGGRILPPPDEEDEDEETVDGEEEEQEEGAMVMVSREQHRNAHELAQGGDNDADMFSNTLPALIPPFSAPHLVVLPERWRKGAQDRDSGIELPPEIE